MTYVLQEKPDEKIVLDNDETSHPVATLADEYGGRAQVVVDDHCYVLHLKQEDGRYKHVAWWFREAVEALRLLPTNPTDAEVPVLRRAMAEKAAEEFFGYMEGSHPLKRYWEETRKRHLLDPKAEDYPYSYFRSEAVRKLTQIIEGM